jgi:hypothetical protein
MRRERQRTWIATTAALAAPPAAAAALLVLRNRIDNTNVALVLVVVVVAVSTLGRRLAGLLAAASSAIWFDFFHTQPFYSFAIKSRDDVVTAGLLLAVGVIVSELAIRSRRHRATAAAHGYDISRIHSMAELVADGERSDFVVMAVAGELRDLLTLIDVRFERSPFDTGLSETGRVLPVLDRSGEVFIGAVEWGADSMGLPTTVVLSVDGNGRQWGRFLLTPTPGLPVPFERRVVAVALADQAGAALAVGNGVRR